MRHLGAGVALVLTLWCTVACERTAPAPPLNLLLVTFDTMRQDAFGIYGNANGHTPTLDALAREGTVFENALAPMGATFPSHATILTGLYPRQHGVRSNVDRLSTETTTLAERLWAHGYETAAFVSYRSMLSRGGLDQGFETLSDRVTGRRSGSVRDGEWISQKATSYLAGEHARPFFLWLHYFEAHTPYRVTPYAAQQLRGYSGPLKDGAGMKTFYSLGSKIPWTPAERRAVRILYDGEVRELDRLIQPVLETLEQRGLAQNTIVVITADHAQALGENGRIGHGGFLDDSVTRVPLIVRHPRSQGAPSRVVERVGLVDVAPTLLQFLEQPPLDGADGRSLAEVWEGGVLEDRLYFTEVSEPIWVKKRTQIARPHVAVYEGNLKSVFDNKGSRTYDLSNDVMATELLGPDARTDRVGELEQIARDYHVPSAPDAGRVVDPAVAEELRALGYLE